MDASIESKNEPVLDGVDFVLGRVVLFRQRDPDVPVVGADGSVDVLDLILNDSECRKKVMMGRVLVSCNASEL